MRRLIPMVFFSLCCLAFLYWLRNQSSQKKLNDMRRWTRQRWSRGCAHNYGTGAAAVEDQNVVMEGGKISVIENGADVAASAGVTVLELRGYSVTPGSSACTITFITPLCRMQTAITASILPYCCPDDILRATPLFGWGHHHHANDRKRGNLCGPESETCDRRRQAARSPHRGDRPVSGRTA